MPPLQLSSESFTFNEVPAKRTAPTKVVGSKKKKKAASPRSNRQHNLLTLPSTASRSEEGAIDIQRTPEVANLLQGRTIYIEKKLAQYNTLREMALAMGANLKESLDKTVTDYITDLKSGKKHLGSTSKQGNRCVSPIWLFTCYNEQKYFPSINFPLDLQTHINTLSAVGSSQSITPSTDINLDDVRNIVNDDNNPFGLEEVDYDYLEAHKPGNQLKLDGFITKEKKSKARNNNESDALYNLAEVESVRLPDEVSSVSEEEEKKQEFFYNNSSSSSSHKVAKKIETPEQLAERKQRLDELKSKLSKAKASVQKANSKVSTRSSSQQSKDTGVFGMEKFKVWYGEQEFKHIDPE